MLGPGLSTASGSGPGRLSVYHGPSQSIASRLSIACSYPDGLCSGATYLKARSLRPRTDDKRLYAQDPYPKPLISVE